MARTAALVFAVAIGSALLLQAFDTGLGFYATDLTYLIREGVPVWTGVATKLVFVMAFTWLFAMRSVSARVAAYGVTFVTLWLGMINLRLNDYHLTPEIVRTVLGDNTTRAYLGAAVRHFRWDVVVAGTEAGLAVIALLLVHRWALPKVATWKAALPLAVLLVGYFGLRGSGYLVSQMPVPIKIPGLLVGYLSQPVRSVPRDPVSLVRAGTPVQRLLFIVDESVRGDLLSINGFAKPTTPFLSRIVADHFNYGIAASGTNSSGTANILLQTGIDHLKVPDTDGLILKTPNIFAYAKAAGYRTVFVSVRGIAGTYSDFMSHYDFESIDEAIYVRQSHPDMPRPQLDAQLEREILDVLHRHPDEKVFVYALKEGSHFVYRDAYPASAARFPDRTGDTTTDVRNSYFNALAWTVDAFLETLLADLRQLDATVVYTSDHGQGLGEAGDQSTHGKPVDPLPIQASVPLAILATGADNARVRSLAATALQANRNRASHRHIFPTVLVLMGYEPAAVRRQYTASLFDVLPDEDRIFLSGDLWGKVYRNRFALSVVPSY
jgi:lipid A ethanolaminephosphotransferase